MRILGVTGPASSGSARVRVLQFVPGFTAAGHEVRTLEWAVRGRRSLALHAFRLLRAARRADVVIVQKPTQHPLLLRAVARRAQLVIDVDDAVWIGSRGEPTAASRRIEQRLARAGRQASLLVVGSQWLADQLARRVPGVRIEVLGSAVDLGSWDEARHSAVRARPPHIVWIGSRGNLRDLHEQFLAGLAPLLREGVAVFEVVCDEAPALDGLADIEVHHTLWSLDDEAMPLVRATLGVMPLLDDDRARGRCSYKAVQYLAAGIVPVASPIGGAVEVVQDGRTGATARSAAEWEAALRALLADPAARTRLVHEGRNLVGERHDLRAVTDQWLALLDEIVG